MTFTVYGIRLKGAKEIKYVGFTRGTLADRLAMHLKTQICLASYRPILPWLRENRDQVEMLSLATCETEAEARATESRLIAMFLKLDHELLNGAQVPHSKRIKSPRLSDPAGRTLPHIRSAGSFSIARTG